ncbi:MAG: hypothetical protein ACKVW3_10895 [Phycisphaerales bacterium]
MTATSKETVRSYLGDLIAVIDHVSRAVAKQAGDDDLRRMAHAGSVIDNLYSVLVRQHADLQAHVKALGGATGGGMVKDILATATGALAGLYGKMRGETASRVLRDDYTAMSFLTACTTMLYTTALALDDTATVDLTHRHIREYPPLIMALSDLLPHAVVADLRMDKAAIANPDAADQATGHLSESWHRASKSSVA